MLQNRKLFGAYGYRKAHCYSPAWQSLDPAELAETLGQFGQGDAHKGGLSGLRRIMLRT